MQINGDSENPKINEYYEKLVSNEARNNLIIEDVKNAVVESRTPLILSDRIEHLKTLKERLVDCAKNVILITGRGTQKQKKEQLEKLNSVQTDESLIILSTGKYAGEGFDFPRIDTLMLVMPFSWKGTLAQYCGRLHRNFKGKDDVRIYDYVDFRISIFDRMYQNRLKGYKQLGYTIKSESCSEDIKENAKKMYDSLEKIKSLVDGSKSYFDSKAGDEIRKKFNTSAEKFEEFRQFLDQYGEFLKNVKTLIADYDARVEEAAKSIEPM